MTHNQSSAGTEHATGRYEFPYNRTFQAIAAATSVYAGGVGVNVSVKAFQEAFNSFPDARPLNEPQSVGMCPEPHNFINREMIERAAKERIRLSCEQREPTASEFSTARQMLIAALGVSG